MLYSENLYIVVTYFENNLKQTMVISLQNKHFYSGHLRIADTSSENQLCPLERGSTAVCSSFEKFNEMFDDIFCLIDRGNDQHSNRWFKPTVRR